MTKELTEKHLEVIRLLSRGYTSRQAARRLDKTQGSIAVRLRVAKRIIKAKTTEQLMFKVGFQLGSISKKEKNDDST